MQRCKPHCAWMLVIPVASFLAGCGDSSSNAKSSANLAPVGVQSADAASATEPSASVAASASGSKALEAPAHVLSVPKSLKCRAQGDLKWLTGLENLDPIGVKASLIENKQWDMVRAEFYHWWGQTNPAEAMKDAESTNPGASTVATGSVLAGWIHTDSRAALKWLADRPENSETVFQAMHVVREVEPSALGSLTQWADYFSNFPSGVVLKSTLAEIWRGENPAEASQWVLGQESTETTPSLLLSKYIESWTVADPQAVSKYLQEMPEGLTKDKAVAAFATGISHEDAPSALVWAKSIVNADLQKQIVSQLPVAAEAVSQ